MTEVDVYKGSTPGTPMDPERLALLKRTIAKDTTEDEFALFVQVCNRTGLDPFARQIYAIKREVWNPKTKRREAVMGIQTSVDGFRLVAERTGKYLGQTPEYWCGPDGEWKDVWLSSDHPAAAKVGVYKAGHTEPTWAVATWREYAQTTKDSDGSAKPTRMWAQMGARMLLKCAESLALRKAFPQELSGLYTVDEMSQATSVVADTEPVVTEVIDHETGEITAPAPKPKTTRRAPPRRPDVGGGEDAGAIGPDPATGAATNGTHQSVYAKAIHIMATDCGLSDEELDEIIFSVTGDPSANSITRDTAAEVRELILARSKVPAS